MTESQPTLDLIQSHFSELADSEQQQLLQNALAHWYDEEARSSMRTAAWRAMAT